MFVWLLKPTGTCSCQLSPSSDKSNDPYRSLCSLSFRGCKIRNTHCFWKGCTCCISESSRAMPLVIVSGLNTTNMITSTKETTAILYLNKEQKAKRYCYLVLIIICMLGCGFSLMETTLRYGIIILHLIKLLCSRTNWGNVHGFETRHLTCKKTNNRGKVEAKREGHASSEKKGDLGKGGLGRCWETVVLDLQLVLL